MLSRFKIGTRLGAAFGIITLLLLGSLSAGWLGLSTVRNIAHHVLETDVSLALNASEVQRLALEERRYEKDSFINIDNAEKVRAYQEKWLNTREKLDQVLQAGQAMATTDDLRGLYTEAVDALEDYAAGYQAVMKDIAAGKIADTSQANQALGDHKAAIYRLEENANAIESLAMADIANSNAVIDVDYRYSLAGLLGFAALALVVSLTLAYVITKSIVRPLRRALQAAQQVANGDLRQKITVSGQDEISELLTAMDTMSRSLTRLVMSLRHAGESVSVGAKEMAQGSQDLSSRTEEQASALQETASSMEEMASTVRQNTESTMTADELSANASRSAQAGGQEVEQTAQLMREIADNSQKVNAIIGVIDSIAFQTNILALNASVEAARAGEQGRGFAVVANEVRSLASRSAASAKEIRTMIEATTLQITAGAKQAERSGKIMRETVEAIRQVSLLISEVATATREQNGGIEQINVAITQMDSVTQQNASLVEQASAAAESLEEQAQRLAGLIATFKVNEPTEKGLVQASPSQPQASTPAMPALPGAARRETARPVKKATEEWTAF
ncbi:methyl-accepting chemotaxis protein [Modicisalibacter xianhensis]|uniref:Methyl-accepting chemotaxis protein n=1 Tax=Modicisalibacter xianhensis TaxID=442341 RepID=A0A1I3DMY3_9GAMM|nr:methyl-accepting chemotaxis protein [Halomonas xianhensis]SFH87949.1 methyl-accepting chemotaxis protein [Halomonas xianhensis]